MDLFILTLFQAGHKLRISTLYHVLIGRKTSSTLLHGFFYGNLGLLGSLPDLQQTEFDQLIERLNHDQLIEVVDGEGQLTKQGESFLKDYDMTAFNSLNGLRYGKNRLAMWQLIVFAVQVVSYLSYHEKEYLPLENRPFYLNYVKQWLANGPKSLLNDFKVELIRALDQLPQATADFLANQFSGVDQVGKAAFQLLPTDYQQVPWNHLYLAATLDRFFATLDKRSQVYRLIQVLDQKNYNQSMLKTRHLFLAGDSVEQIMQKRNLKQGTVNDHFIEWALIDDQFPFERFELKPELFINEIRDYRYQEFADWPYLLFRLSQVKALKEQEKWN